MAQRHFICVVDEAGNEIAGSRRYVDFTTERDRYFRLRAELEAAMSDECQIFDSEIDGTISG